LNIELPVLEQWDFQVFEAEAQGKVIRLETDVGTKCLYIRTFSPKTVFRLFLVTEYIAQQGLKKVPRFIRTKYGEPYQKSGRRFYWVADWIFGRSVNPLDQNDMVKTARKLAEFHGASKGFYLPGEEHDVYAANNWGLMFLIWPPKLQT